MISRKILDLKINYCFLKRCRVPQPFAAGPDGGCGLQRQQPPVGRVSPPGPLLLPDCLFPARGASPEAPRPTQVHTLSLAASPRAHVAPEQEVSGSAKPGGEGPGGWMPLPLPRGEGGSPGLGAGPGGSRCWWGQVLLEPSPTACLSHHSVSDSPSAGCTPHLQASPQASSLLELASQRTSCPVSLCLQGTPGANLGFVGNIPQREHRRQRVDLRGLQRLAATLGSGPA